MFSVTSVVLESANLGALNLTDGILFLVEHKLVWEQGRETASENH